MPECDHLQVTHVEVGWGLQEVEVRWTRDGRSPERPVDFGRVSGPGSGAHAQATTGAHVARGMS